MRIVGGTFKGRKFQAPKKIPARPTTDYAKEGLFNILEHRIDWSTTNFLDLFSGIGSITLEATSRGAATVTAIDKNRFAVRWLQECLQTLKVEGAHVFTADALQWLGKHEHQKFNLVFADPPYDFHSYPQLIESVLQHALLNDGMLILEHRQNISFEEHPNFAEDRTYGEVKFTFFRID